MQQGGKRSRCKKRARKKIPAHKIKDPAIHTSAFKIPESEHKQFKNQSKLSERLGHPSMNFERSLQIILDIVHILNKLAHLYFMYVVFDVSAFDFKTSDELLNFRVPVVYLGEGFSILFLATSRKRKNFRNGLAGIRACFCIATYNHKTS